MCYVYNLATLLLQCDDFVGFTTGVYPCGSGSAVDKRANTNELPPASVSLAFPWKLIRLPMIALVH